MPTAAVNGIDLYYESDGNGGAIIGLHGGLGFDHTYMRRGLAGIAEIARIITPDLRCNGRSGGPIETLSMEQLADDVAGLMDALGLPRATVLGHSYGGFVAQEFALRHPDRLDRLVLVDTTPGQPGEHEVVPDGPPQPEGLAELFSNPPMTDEEAVAFVPKILPYYLHTLQADEAMPFFEGSVMRVEAMAAGFAVMAEWSTVDRLAQVDAPTLALCGRHDVITSLPQSGRITSRIRRAELRVFEKSGHFPFIEEPGAFVSELRQWLGAGEQP